MSGGGPDQGGCRGQESCTNTYHDMRRYAWIECGSVKRFLPFPSGFARTMRDLADRLSAKKIAGSCVAPPFCARLDIAVYLGLSSFSAISTRIKEFPDPPSRME